MMESLFSRLTKRAHSLLASLDPAFLRLDGQQKQIAQKTAKITNRGESREPKPEALG
jgi:hypothetical protein